MRDIILLCAVLYVIGLALLYISEYNTQVAQSYTCDHIERVCGLGVIERH